MKAIIDHSLCEGHSRCMDEVPEVFDVGDDDRSYLLFDLIPAEFLEKVKHAASVCPRAAISLTDE
jgi:ferredoxin